MKYHIITACAAVLFTTFSMAQNSTTIGKELNNLAPPNSPAFVLMDVTPSTVITPESLQAFSIQTLSAFSGGDNDASKNNYAVEIQPYWYTTRQDMNFLKYNNLTTSKPKGSDLDVEDYDGYNIFGDLWKRASVSMAFMSGTFDVFEESQSYISVGARTRLVSYKTKRQTKRLKAIFKDYDAFTKSDRVIQIYANPTLTPTQIKDKIVNDSTYKRIKKDFEDYANKKPLFSIDVAIAYSHFMGDKDADYDGGFGRFGFWTSSDLALNLDNIDNDCYFHIYGVFRYLRDGLNLNADNELFTETKIDYGGIVELEFKKLSFAYEYLSRDADNNDDSRSIGSIRYKISDQISINGGFGKNFISDGNTVAIFGIQWGLSKGGSLKLN